MRRILSPDGLICTKLPLTIAPPVWVEIATANDLFMESTGTHDHNHIDISLRQGVASGVGDVLLFVSPQRAKKSIVLVSHCLKVGNVDSINESEICHPKTIVSALSKPTNEWNS